MPKYELNLRFTEKDLPVVYKASEEVVIVKHVEGQSNVAWISFKPFEYNNVKWGTDFALYASTSTVQGGAKIDKLSATNAQTQVNYAFDDAVFKTELNGAITVGPNTYAVTNNMQGYTDLTMGLAQSLEVNGEKYTNNPINAVTVPFKHSAEMTPIERIDVYLKADIETSTVLTHISSVSIPLTYSGDINKFDILYDGAVGKFIPDSAV